MMSRQFHTMFSSYKPPQEILKIIIDFYMKNELISDEGYIVSKKRTGFFFKLFSRIYTS